MTDRQVRHTAV